MNAPMSLETVVYDVERNFIDVRVDPAMGFKREAEFAMQQLTRDEYTRGIALKDPQGVRDAVTNVAAIGISLNPARKLAYLVPRDGKICLDLSYLGLVEIAVQSGSIRWGKANLVHELDTFELNGFDRPPTHQFQPFSKARGEVVGVYVVAKTIDGDYLTDTMTIDEVHAIRNRSAAWKSGKSNPWKTDEGEMIKKTVIKRASKMWPKTERLDKAVHYLNTEGGEGIELSGEEGTFALSGWLSKVTSARDLFALDEIRKAGLAEIAKAKDGEAYKVFRAAVLARVDALKSEAVNEPVTEGVEREPREHD